LLLSGWLTKPADPVVVDGAGRLGVKEGAQNRLFSGGVGDFGGMWPAREVLGAYLLPSIGRVRIDKLNERMPSAPCEDQEVMGKNSGSDSCHVMFPAFAVATEHPKHSLEE